MQLGKAEVDSNCPRVPYVKEAVGLGGEPGPDRLHWPDLEDVIEEANLEHAVRVDSCFLDLLLRLGLGFSSPWPAAAAASFALAIVTAFSRFFILFLSSPLETISPVSSSSWSLAVLSARSAMVARFAAKA